MCLLQMNYELQKNVHATENFPFLLLNIPHTQIVKEDLKVAHGPPSLTLTVLCLCGTTVTSPSILLQWTSLSVPAYNHSWVILGYKNRLILLQSSGTHSGAWVRGGGGYMLGSTTMLGSPLLMLTSMNSTSSNLAFERENLGFFL